MKTVNREKVSSAEGVSSKIEPKKQPDQEKKFQWSTASFLPATVSIDKVPFQQKHFSSYSST